MALCEGLGLLLVLLLSVFFIVGFFVCLVGLFFFFLSRYSSFLFKLSSERDVRVKVEGSTSITEGESLA